MDDAGPSERRGRAPDLMPEAYDELREIARRMLMAERRGHSLDATALVNEAYLKLAGLEDARWDGTVHFRAAAARAARQVLVDHARRRDRVKRGGDRMRLTLETRLLADGAREIDVCDLDDALRVLEAAEPRAVAVVEMRFFAGLSIREAAEHLDVGTATVERDWRFARAWLYRELLGEDPRLERAAGLTDAQTRARRAIAAGGDGPAGPTKE